MKHVLNVPTSREIDSIFAKFFDITGAGYTSDTQGANANVLTSFTLTTGATPHDLTAYTEIVASLSQNVQTLMIQIGANSQNGVNSSCLMNIAIGGAGSETVVVANLDVGMKAQNFTNQIIIPLKLDKGTRVAVNIQSAVALKNYTFKFVFGKNDKKMRAMQGYVDTYGADTANSRGTAISTPGSTNSKGSYTEITSSTNQAYQGFFITVGGVDATAISAGGQGVDIAIGSVGNETIIEADIPTVTATSEGVDLPVPALFRKHIPKGTRISARFSRSITSQLDIIFHGIPY